MKKTLLTVLCLGSLASGLALADRRDYHQALNRCAPQDAVCAARVLLRAMDEFTSAPQPGPVPPPVLKGVEFYSSDSCSSGLLAQVTFGMDSQSNQQKCRELSNVIRNPVWGIKIDGGACQNITDTDFLSACIAFAP